MLLFVRDRTALAQDLVGGKGGVLGVRGVCMCVCLGGLFCTLLHKDIINEMGKWYEKLALEHSVLH